MKNLASRLRQKFFQSLLVALTPAMILLPTAVSANPSGASVAAGAVNFNGLGTSSLTIHQNSATAIINWQNFSIGAGEITQFVQPGASSLAINRVVSGNPSAIYGQLTANGGVMVINPNGVLVGPSGVIDVGGALTLSTLDATNRDLLDGGSTTFSGRGSAGVSNFGAISGQDVVLLGNFISNAGSIVADRSVALGAGGDIVLSRTADGATISVRGGGAGGAVGIENTGSVTGGNVEMATHGNSYALGINNQGVARASAYNFSGGRLTLRAGSGGRMVNTGQLYARRQDGSGGQIQVSGEDVTIGSGRVDASGAPGMDGGTVEVTASDITVGSDALIIADGENAGSINLQASGRTEVGGQVSARGIGNGGQVDLQGDMVSVEATALVDASGGVGGRIRAGGGFQGNDADMINSSATEVAEGALLIADGESGDGGEVIVWSDGDTLFAGEVSARAKGVVGNGGFVEVSGRSWLSFFGFANTSAANGITGTLLLDPSNVVIGPTGTVTMTDAALVAAVLNSNVVIHTSSGGTAEGDITINPGSDIQYDSPNSLAFFAHRNIFVNGDVKNHGTTDTAFAGTGNITLFAGWDGTGAENFGFDPDAATFGASDPNISAADILSGTYGQWGQNAGSIFINDAAQEPVEVGSARGETNAFSSLFVLTGGETNGEFSQFGYRRENDTRGTAPTASGTINTGLDLDFDTGVTGNINVYGDEGVFLVQDPGSDDADGVKNHARTYVMIGHGGLRSDANDVDNRGGSDFGSDSGNVTVGNGDNHGNITVMTNGVLQVQAPRNQGYAMVGHGGLGSADPNSNRDFVVSDRTAQNNNFRTTHIFGNMTGDITIEAGQIDLEAGRYSDSHAQIGHGGNQVRGEHSGNIDITTTLGGLRARAAPDSASGGPANSNDWRWTNNRARSYVQVGHGGFNSDFVFVDTLGAPGTAGGVAGQGTDPYDTSGAVQRPDDANGVFMDAIPQRPTLLTTGNGDEVVNAIRPGDGIPINNVRGAIRDSDGVTGIAFGHSGDITINSAGDIEFVASNGNIAHAHLGHGGSETHGDHRGDVTVNSGGDVIFTREAFQVNERGRDITNRGDRSHVQIGHGGNRYAGGSIGDIMVSAAGNVEFYAGRQESFAQIGHGGRGVNGTVDQGGDQRTILANGTHSGDITVDAGGDIIFRSGFTNNQAHSMIGHGGWYQYADVVENTSYPVGTFGELFGGATDPDQEGHNGDIVVVLGGDISFVAGQTEALLGQTYLEQNGTDNFTMIGHGGRLSRGDHYGSIEINAAGDLEMEARGGWDSVSIQNNAGDNNTNTLGTPRLGNNEDFSRFGLRNFAQVGHGGHDSEHSNSDATNGINNSGKNSDGIGVLGNSDILINLGGDLNLLAAQKETVLDRPMPTQISLDNGGGDIGNTPAEYSLLNPDGTQSPATLGPEFRQHNARLDRIVRDDGEVWDLPEPVVTAIDSYVQIGNGGRASEYRGSGGADNGGGEGINPIDGLGHRGNVTINVGGEVTVEASNIKPAVATGQSLEISVQNYQANPGGVGTIGGAGSYFVGPSVTEFINGADTQDDGSAGLRNYAMIGVGGNQSRGDHIGNVTILGDGDPLNGGDLFLIAGEGREAFAMIGAGGYDTDRLNNNDNNRAGDTGMTTEITITIDGELRIEGGGLQDGDTTGAVGSFNDDGTVNFNDGDRVRGSFAQIGGGGVETGGNHNAEIAIDAQGDITLRAGNTGRGGYAQIGSGGGNVQDGGTETERSETLTGDISVISRTGDISLTGSIPQIDTEDDPNVGPANLGNIGVGRENYAMIGNGGFDTDFANVIGFSGDIEVIAVQGSVTLQGGGDISINAANDNFRAYFAQIGNGGHASAGNHTGDIRVVAGTDLNIFGGFGTREAYAQIGNGGHNTDGNHSGTIDIDVGRDLNMQRGASNTTTGLDVINAWAKIGHGSQSFGGRNNGGTGVREGDILVSIGDDLITVNGVSPEFVEDEVITDAVQVLNTPFTLAGIDQSNEGVNLRSLQIQSDDGGGNTVNYNDNGTGQIVESGTANVVGSIDYTTGRITMTNDISAGGTLTVEVDYSTTEEADSGLGPLIGHVDLLNTDDGTSIGADGNTFIAVGRNDPFATGSDLGVMTLSDGTVFTSADGGLTTELRLYMPTAAQNEISTGAFLNNQEYDRDALGGVGNRLGEDENLATEHTLEVGLLGEPSGTFGDPAEGNYGFHSLGLYNVYFASAQPIDPPDPPGPVIPPTPGFEFGPFFFPESFDYDSYERSERFGEETDEEPEGEAETGGRVFYIIGDPVNPYSSGVILGGELFVSPVFGVPSP